MIRLIAKRKSSRDRTLAAMYHSGEAQWQNHHSAAPWTRPLTPQGRSISSPYGIALSSIICGKDSAMKRRIASVVVAFLAMVVTGCKSYYQSGSGLNVYGLEMEPLKRNEYKVLETTEGTGKVIRVLFMTFGEDMARRSSGLNRGMTAGMGTSFGGTSLTGGASLIEFLLAPITGLFGPPDSTQAALYHALENAEGADALLCPRVKTEVFSFPLIFCISTSTVKARAVQVIRDKS